MFVYLTRLYFLMESGQRLGINVIQSKRALEEYSLIHEIESVLTIQYSRKLSMLQKRLDVYQVMHPISPYSVFNLSYKTYYSTLGVILTYIVLLIKLKGGPSKADPIEDSKDNEIENLIEE